DGAARRQLSHRCLRTQRLGGRHEVEEAGGGGPRAAPAGWTALRSQREALIAVEAEGELPEGQMDAAGHRVVALRHGSMHLRPGSEANPAPPDSLTKNQTLGGKTCDRNSHKMSEAQHKSEPPTLQDLRTAQKGPVLSYVERAAEGPTRQMALFQRPAL